MAKSNKDLENLIYYTSGGVGIVCLITLIIACTLAYYVYNLRRKVKKLSENVEKLRVFRNKKDDDSDDGFEEVGTSFKDPYGWQNPSPSHLQPPTSPQNPPQNLRQSFQNRNPGFQFDEPQQQPWRMDEPRTRDEPRFGGEPKRMDPHIPRVLPSTFQGQRNPLANLAQPRNNTMPQNRSFGNQQYNRGGY